MTSKSAVSWAAQQSESESRLVDLLNPAWTRLPTYVAGLSEETVRERFGLSHVVKLASNENPLGPGRAAIEAIRNAATGAARYPDPGALETALSRKLGVDPGQLTLTSGSSEALDLLARGFLSGAVEAVAGVPSFILYPIVVQAAGARLLAVPTRADWSVDLEALLAACTEATRLVLLGNPNNPTGLWHREAELVAFLERLPPRVVVVLDEAYFEYVQESEYPDGIRLLSRFPNLVVIRTFSKVHGLAGLRVGYAVSHPTIAEALKRARPPFNVNTLAISAALAALGDDAHVQASVTLNRENRAKLAHALGKRGIETLPSVANFVAARLGPKADQIVAGLLRLGVIVRPINNMPGFARITIGTDLENQRLLDALDEACG